VDSVTLLGVGNAEIVGRSGQEATMTIAGRRSVVLKNLRVSNGFPGVLVQGGTGIVLDAVEAVQNTGNGLQFDNASTGQLTDCLASQNGNDGISVHNGSRVTFFGDNLSSYNQNDGINILNDAEALVGQVQDTPRQKRLQSKPPRLRGSELQSSDLGENRAAAARCGTTIVGNTKYGVLVAGGSYFYVGPGCMFVSRKNGRDGIRFTGVSSGDFLEAHATMSINTGRGMSVRDTSSVAIDGTTVRALSNGANGINVEDTSELGVDIYGGSTINSRLCSKKNNHVGLAVIDLSFVSCGGGVAVTLHPNGTAATDVSVDSLLTCAVTPVNACSNLP
jgi:hypothetical protein